MSFKPYVPMTIPVNSWVKNEKNPFVSPNAILLMAKDIKKILQPGLFSSCYRVTHNDKKFKSVRFLLNTDGKLRFSPDDSCLRHDGSVPHFWYMAVSGEVMTYACDGTPIEKTHQNAVCWSAGRVFFDDKDRVCGIAADSIEFAVPIDSLQLALDAMKNENISMASEIFVFKRDDDGRKTEFIIQPFSAANPLALSMFSARRSFLDQNKQAELQGTIGCCS